MPRTLRQQGPHRRGVHTEVSLAVSLESREEVDELADRALDAGAQLDEAAFEEMSRSVQ